jgi:phosphatidylglycerol lysyltransferase
MSDAQRRWLPLLSLALLAAALWTLDRELQRVTFHQLARAIGEVPLTSVLAALALTAVNYLVLTGYDQFAFVYAGRTLSRWRITVASFVGYAISNNVGFALLSGTSARYRFYSRWGLTAEELSRIVLFYSGTFWLGLFVLGGWSLLVIPAADLPPYAAPLLVRATGWLLLAVSAAYAVSPFLWRRPLRIRGFDVTLPSPRLVAIQFALSIVDWALAVAVLWVLLPAPRPPFGLVVAAFLAAQLLGLASHVPGGLGVFESLFILLLRSVAPAATLLPALVAYRAIYYLLPLAGALVVLTLDELRQRRADLRRWSGTFGGLAVAVAPKVLSFFTFVAGAVLLFSGATPAGAGRLAWLSRLLPLPIVELSHFAGSLLGLALLVLSQGIARRLDVAYHLTLGALGLGIVASLLKGGDYEEAVILALIALAFLPSREDFDRRTAFFEARFSVAWFSAVVAVVAASIWLGFFAYRHVEYTSELWWRFAFHQEASRFLRASLGVTLALFVYGVSRLLKPTPPELPETTDTDIADADRVITTQNLTYPLLVHLRDKALLWNDDRTGFIMYGVQGRTWVAMGDPVGPAAVRADLVRRFLERADDFDAVPVFYEVRRDNLHLYADFGLTFVKLGEEGRVRLGHFSLEGSANKEYRQVVRRLEREGRTFRIVPAAEVPSILPALRSVSDEWLASKAAAEKGFSLGFFDESYVRSFPAGVIERHGEIEAFATLWPGPPGTEASVDLMRYREGARGVMDGLFVHLLLWANAQGYQWFSLGMAPLAGLEASAVAPLWVKLGAFVYRHGEAFYNFQGLRAYKEKFDPVWEPHYLAYPGGLALPRVLADISALIAGGYLHIVRK